MICWTRAGYRIGCQAGGGRSCRKLDLCDTFAVSAGSQSLGAAFLDCTAIEGWVTSESTVEWRPAGCLAISVPKGHPCVRRPTVQALAPSSRRPSRGRLEGNCQRESDVVSRLGVRSETYCMSVNAGCLAMASRSSSSTSLRTSVISTDNPLQSARILSFATKSADVTPPKTFTIRLLVQVE